MSSPASQQSWSKQDWKYKAAAQAFRENHGNPLYTMVFNSRLQRKMERDTLPVLMRVDALIDRMANGNLSDCVVDAMPRIYDADPLPRKLTQVEIAARLGISTAAVSGACKLLREQDLVLPDPGDGSILPNQCVVGELFEASQRAGSPALPLEKPQDDDELPKFSDFKATWLSEHPDHVAAKMHLIQERENLRAQVRDLAADIRDLELIELAAYRAVCREIERNRREAAAHSTNGNGSNIHGVQSYSTAAGAADSGCEITLPVETVHDSTPPIEPKASVFNSDSAISSKVGTIPSSSSGGNVTESATTTTKPVPTPQTPEPGDATHSGERSWPEGQAIIDATPPSAAEIQTPQSMSDVEFHQALSIAFRSAGKPVPTLGQSAICYVDLGSLAARGFLAWLETPYRPGERPLPPKLPAVQHPGVLKALVLEYKSWCASEPPPPPAAPPPKPACALCGGSGFPGFTAPGGLLTSTEARDLVATGIRPCTCETGKLWQEMLE